jgi:hypothetical protein
MLQSDEELEQKMVAWEAHLAATDPGALAELEAQIAELEGINPELANRQHVLEVTLIGLVEILRHRRVLRYSAVKYRSLLGHIMAACRQPYLLSLSLDKVLEDHFDPNDALEEMSRCAELNAQSRQKRKLTL